MGLTPPNIGELRSIVAFENSAYKNRLGLGTKDNFDQLTQTRGKLVKNSGRRAISGFEMTQVSDYTLWIRYRPEYETAVTIKTRVTVENRLFSIDSVAKVGQKNFYLQIDLTEQKA